MRRDPVRTAMNAIGNVSRDAIDETDLRRTPSTGDGPGHLVRALFDDCSFETLDQLGATFGLSLEQVRRAYRRAKTRNATSNTDVDAIDGVAGSLRRDAPLSTSPTTSASLCRRFGRRAIRPR